MKVFAKHKTYVHILLRMDKGIVMADVNKIGAHTHQAYHFKPASCGSDAYIQ